jgi:hypothetical protein
MDRQDNKVMKIKFSGKDCMPCPGRESCIRSVKDYKRRIVTIRRPREHHEALTAAREQERTAELSATPRGVTKEGDGTPRAAEEERAKKRRGEIHACDAP